MIRMKQSGNRLENTLRSILFLTFAISIVILGYLLVVSPSSIDDPSYISGQYTHLKSHYILMFAQSLLGIVVMFLPDLFERRFNMDIPSYLVIMYLIFLYCAIFLGEVRSFYYDIPYWDMILHGFSAAMLGLFGYSVIFLLNANKNVPLQLSPAFMCLFAFTFALMCGVLWEIYEFTFDGLWGMNMQKFMAQDGTMFIGRAALADTMEDLVVDTIGAGIVCLINYGILKLDRNWINRFRFKALHGHDHDGLTKDKPSENPNVYDKIEMNENNTKE